MMKKTTSPKLKCIMICGYIISVILILCVFSMIIFSSTFIPLVYTILTSISICGLGIGLLIIFLYYKELKKITNASAEYYSRTFPDFFTDALVVEFCFFISVMIFIKDINISLSILITIHTGIFALVFTLYVFVLPLYRKKVAAKTNKLNSLIKKIHNMSNLKKLQGKIYKNNKDLNHLSTSILAATIIFLISIIVYATFGQALITYFIMFASTLFDISFILRIIYLSHKIYSCNLDKLQNLFENQCIYFERKSNQKNKDKV